MGNKPSKVALACELASLMNDDAELTLASRLSKPVIYSYVGTPDESIGNEGDFILEEMTGLLIGPKTNGVWPEEWMQVKGPIVGKLGWLPRWRFPKSRAKPYAEVMLVRYLRTILRLILGGRGTGINRNREGQNRAARTSSM